MERTTKLRRLAPDQFHMLVKMHLSFLLDLTTDDCDCSFLYENEPVSTPTKSKGLAFVTPRKKTIPNPTTSSKVKGVMEGAPLTVEGVCQVFQIIEYLRRPINLKIEGLFRKHGNLKKQQTLKERLNKGITINLDSGEFSVHECAATLKNFLSDLPEPLLTDAYYKAHCQVASFEGEDTDEKKVQCLQLLFLLIPEPNYNLLRDLLKLLSLVSDNADHNKMNAVNLATVFATHILCPRKISPDCLQSKHQLFIKAVAFMIEHSESLFTIPTQLVKDVDMFWQRHSEKDLKETKQPFGPTNSPVVNTVFSFVDRQKTKEASLVSTTETALAELYAQVQAMPESAQKKRLISKLNDANGYGTPSLSTKKRRRPGADASSKLMHLLTPKSKGPSTKNQKKEGKNHGSYNVGSRAQRFDASEATPISSYKRQNSTGNSNAMVTFTTDASPVLNDGPKPPKPAPPPRVSSLRKNADESSCQPKDLLETPRCRKPLAFGLSPMLESPANPEESSKANDSTASSLIENEANLLLTGEMDPSDSMTHFLDGGSPSGMKNPAPRQVDHENESPNVLTPKTRKKRSITELGGPNPLVKNTTPMRNCENVYFETDF